MEPSQTETNLLPGALAIRAHQFVYRLARLYVGFLVLVVLLLALVFWPGEAMARTRLLLEGALHGGLAVLMLSSLALAVLTLGATLLLTVARQQGFIEAPALVERPTGKFALPTTGFTPSLMARQGQAILLPLGAILICVLCWGFSRILSFQPVSPDAKLGAGLAILAAFLSLIAERMIADYPAAQLPEASSLRRVLLFVTVMLGLAGLVQIAESIGLGWVEWPVRILVWLPALVALELGLRAFARYFAPAPADSEARAGTDSILITLLTAGPRKPGDLLREHLGLDFTRSWALTYLKSAALPAITITVVFCWCLSGLKLIAYDERDVYERLGAPVAVMGPGLHLVLPWPFGRVRPVEFGRVHTIVAGLNHALADIETIGAEDTAPASMNRLWETINPTEVEYLVASQSSNQQGFQAVSAEVRVLYRTGLSDADALAAIYGAENPDSLVKDSASRIATRYFASHTLDDVMGARRDRLDDTMRREIAADLAPHHAGIDVVAVVIQAIHPPAGAAEAYHAVQAAEINADASISDETARAEHTMGTAQQEATQTLDEAQAHAGEILQAANGDAYRFDADVRASRLEPTSFLLERRFDNLTSSLANRRLIIMDNRLKPGQEPLIDMRPPSQGATDGGGLSNLVAPSALTATPGTSTEGNVPPITIEQANAQARQTQRPGRAGSGP